jgi:hypothetical protein
MEKKQIGSNQMNKDLGDTYYFSFTSLVRRHAAGLSLSVLAIIGSIGILAVSPKPDQDLIFVLGLFVAGILMLIPTFWAYLNRIQWVKLTDSGMSWQVKDNVKMKSWGDCRDYFYSDVTVNGYRRQECLVKFIDEDNNLRITQSIGDFDRLSEEVRYRSLEARLTSILEQDKSRKQFSFGPIQYSHDSLTIQNTVLPWKDVDKIEAIGGWFHVYHHKKSSPLGSLLQGIPNYDILFQKLTEDGRPFKLP